MKILLADDSPTVRAVVSTALGAAGLEILEAEDGAAAWRALDGPAAPRLALLNWEMPQVDGVEICRRLREREARGAPYTYVLVLTARSRKQDLLCGLDAGADDFVVKPFDPDELRSRVLAGRRIIELQTELYRMQAMFRDQSRTDPLTGCLNRRAILERLGAEMSAARREVWPLAMAILDIDHFKAVNDHHGHRAGDLVLCDLVDRLQHRVRASDAFGRFGGEEFLILWPRARDAAVVAERTRAVMEAVPFEVGGEALRVTVSLGVTTTMGDETAEAVLARADQALYVAKNRGRNRIEVASSAASRRREAGCSA